MSAVFKAGHTAVITGGASGIGLALAKKCHGFGMKVLAIDRNETQLNEIPKTISPDVLTHNMDVSQASEWEKLKDIVQRGLGGKINLLALNAGIGPQSEWSDLASFHKIFDTNVFGVVNGLNALLPVVQESATSSSPSAIVITGSKQGITNPPGNVAYNASKSAVKTIAEYLDYDQRHNANLSVHLLVPGWTFTGLTSKTMKDKPDGAWWPEQVIDYLEKKMGEGQFYVLCPDNDVTEELDRKRMAWGAGDAIEGRPPMSRWREDWKDRAKEGIEGKK